ncbi:calcium-binding protein [Cyanobacteria bacterium FACHB-471]|nr:calcium-binding protein [Cyanobacteria bacterium FACHB-471]
MPEYYFGTIGNDYYNYNGSDQLIAYGYGGDDFIWGNNGADGLYGDDGNDELRGWSGNDELYGGAGNDTLKGESGDDYMAGGTGNDTYYVDSAYSLSSNGDIVKEYAGEGTDTIYTSVSLFSFDSSNVENFVLTGDATLCAGNSLSNKMEGNQLDNILYAYAGNDSLYGNAGSDSLYGYEGNDTLDGGDGNDTLSGGSGSDVLVGGTGDDILIGGAGNDTLTSGSGFNVFRFNNISEKVDKITDFASYHDDIQVVKSGFSSSLNLGTIAAGQFRLGSSAGDSSDRFIYNQSTGALFFDKDGTGSAGQVQFATLSNKASLSYTDIVVIA